MLDRGGTPAHTKLGLLVGQLNHNSVLLLQHCLRLCSVAAVVARLTAGHGQPRLTAMAGLGTPLGHSYSSIWLAAALRFNSPSETL